MKIHEVVLLAESANTLFAVKVIDPKTGNEKTMEISALTATEAKSGTKVDLQFQITALDCSPVGLSATPSTPKVTQLQAP